MYTREYHVLIADDERLICDLLRKIIEWDALNLKLVGVIRNGKDLLEEIIRLKPDIVITDICMPDINGIELIRRIREMGLPCRFIIVSGYRQFEYAHNAMRFDVDDYILKPIDASELNNSLRKTIASLECKSPGGNGATTERKGLNHLLIQHLLINIDEENASSLSQLNAKYGTDFCEGTFCVAIIKLDILEDTIERSKNATALSESIAQTITTRLNGVCNYLITDASIDSVNILLNYDASAQTVVMDALTDSFHISEHIADLFIGLRMVLAIGNPCDDIRICRHSYDQAMIALWNRICHPMESILYYSHLSTNIDLSFRADALSEYTELLSSIDNLDLDALHIGFTALKDCMVNDENTTRTGVLLLSLCAPIAEKLSSRLERPTDAHFIENELRQAFFAAYSIESLQKGYFDTVLSMAEQLSRESEARLKRPIRQAIEYIDNNYAKPLNLESVAGIVFLSPHYFSNLFVREVGSTFSEYLNHVRINAAKRYLRNTNMTINEIAESVGYADARYFSKVFIKDTGIKPKDYRKFYG